MNNLLRRRIAKSGLALAALGSVGLTSLSRGSNSRIALGLQLFSVDEDMKRDLPGTLRAVRTIGYRDVELVGYYGRSVAELRKALDQAELRAASIHLRPQQRAGGLPSLEQDPDMHFARCRDLGIGFVVCPGPWFPERIASLLPAANVTLSDVAAAARQFTADDWQRSAELINRCAARARQHDLQFAYHNGNLEFGRVNGETGYDRLLRLMDPKLVQLEMDCGWIMAAGYDAITYLKAQAGRVPMVHIKDMKETPANTAMQLNSAELGTGIVNWPRLMNAIEATGVKRAYVEQEAPFVRPPMESALINYNFLARFGKGGSPGKHG